jgi:hypothetical protein
MAVFGSPVSDRALERTSEDIERFLREYSFQIVNETPGRSRKGIKIKYHEDPEIMGERLLWKYFRAVLREVDDSMVDDHVSLYYRGSVKKVLIEAIEDRIGMNRKCR